MNIMTVAIKIVPYIIVIPIMETKYLNNKKWLIYRAEHSLKIMHINSENYISTEVTCNNIE